MGRLFDLESPFMEFIGKIADLILLSVLWIVCCIPVVTIGASTAALYYVTLKMVRQEDAGITKLFWKSFKENLKQGMVLTILFILCAVVLFLDFRVVSVMEENMKSVLSFVFVLLFVLFLCVMLYTFPLQAQFVNPIPGTLKNALLLSIRNFPSTIVMLIINLLPAVVAVLFPQAFLWLLPLWVCLTPATNAYLCAKKLNKIFAPLVEEHLSANN